MIALPNAPEINSLAIEAALNGGRSRAEHSAMLITPLEVANAALVAWVVAQARVAGRAIATPAEARRIAAGNGA